MRKHQFTWRKTFVEIDPIGVGVCVFNDDLEPCVSIFIRCSFVLESYKKSSTQLITYQEFLLLFRQFTSHIVFEQCFKIITVLIIQVVKKIAKLHEFV